MEGAKFHKYIKAATCVSRCVYGRCEAPRCDQRGAPLAKVHGSWAQGQHGVDEEGNIPSQGLSTSLVWRL